LKYLGEGSTTTTACAYLPVAPLHVQEEDNLGYLADKKEKGDEERVHSSTFLSDAQRAASLGSARKAEACGSHSTGDRNEVGEDGVEDDVESEEEEEEEVEGADRDHSDFLSDAEWAARPPNATLQARQGALLSYLFRTTGAHHLVQLRQTACFSFCSLQARGEAAAMGAFLADAAAVGLHG